MPLSNFSVKILIKKNKGCKAIICSMYKIQHKLIHYYYLFYQSYGKGVSTKPHINCYKIENLGFWKIISKFLATQKNNE